MQSEKRDVLKDHLYQNSKFVAMVQSVNKNQNHMILMDVCILVDETFVNVAKHLHVFNVPRKELKGVTPYKIIVFNAVPYNYSKLDVDSRIFNYSLNGISNITVVEGKGYVKKGKTKKQK